MGRRATGANYEACYEVLCGGSHITGRRLVHKPGRVANGTMFSADAQKVNLQRLSCSVALCQTGRMAVFPGWKARFLQARREGFSFATAMERKKTSRRL